VKKRKGIRHIKNVPVTIGLHEEIKKIAADEGTTQGGVANNLMILGLVKREEMLTGLKNETPQEPADEATGD
jgi:hypothetical protein